MRHFLDLYEKKMQAAVVVQFGKPLELQEWDIPTPGPGQILRED